MGPWLHNAALHLARQQLPEVIWQPRLDIAILFNIAYTMTLHCAPLPTAGVAADIENALLALPWGSISNLPAPPISCLVRARTLLANTGRCAAFGELCRVVQEMQVDKAVSKNIAGGLNSALLYCLRGVPYHRIGDNGDEKTDNLTIADVQLPLDQARRLFAAVRHQFVCFLEQRLVANASNVFVAASPREAVVSAITAVSMAAVASAMKLVSMGVASLLPASGAIAAAASDHAFSIRRRKSSPVAVTEEVARGEQCMGASDGTALGLTPPGVALQARSDQAYQMSDGLPTTTFVERLRSAAMQHTANQHHRTPHILVSCSPRLDSYFWK